MFHRQNNVARMITLDGTGSECSYANPTSHRCNQDLGGAQEVALRDAIRYPPHILSPLSTIGLFILLLKSLLSCCFVEDVKC